MPVNTVLISQPAISAACSTAFLMELTVLSILMTTPLRIPDEPWEPIPIISKPRSVISPTAVQILDVPMSNPTMMLCFLAMTLLPILCFLLRHPTQAGHHLILETYIQGAESFLFSFPQCQYAIQPLQLPFPVAPAHVNRHRMSDRVEDQSVRCIEMNF